MKEFTKDSITGYTELLTLMAYPIRHSRSPAMHNEAFRVLGLDYVYLCFEVDRENLPGAIDAMRALKIRGGNISMPNKSAVLPLLDELSPQAGLCQAVNTIVNEDGHLVGHMTDGIGFVRALEDAGFDLRGRKMTILGAGGVAKAIQVESARAGLSEMAVFNERDAFWGRAKETVSLLCGKPGCRAELFELSDLAALKTQIRSSDLVVNATSVGMKPLEGKSCVPDPSFFKAGMTAMDVIYEPAETPFLKMAREAGCRTLNGLSMMLFQGAESFRLWTGREMPIGHMKEFLGIEPGNGCR